MVLWFLLKSLWAFEKLWMNAKDTGNFGLPEQEPPEIVILFLKPVEQDAMLIGKVGFVDGISRTHVLSLSPAL